MGTTYQIQDQSAIYFSTYQVVGWADIFTKSCYQDELIDEGRFETRKECLNMVCEYHARINNSVEKRQFWTHENHFVELATNEIIDSNLQYNHQNPVRASIVNETKHYIYSSARNYARIESIVQVELL